MISNVFHFSLAKAAILFITAYLFLSSNVVQADIGSVSIPAVTDSTMSVSWTAPTGNYKLSGSTPNYKICYKKAGTWASACNQNVVYSNTTSITLSGLNAMTEYKVKVYCHCEKKNMWGNWKNPKWRKIGVNNSTTSPVAIPNAFLITGSTTVSLDVHATHNNMADFDAVRICYKKKWNLVIDFVGTCGSLFPEASWTGNDPSLGYFDVAAANPVNTVVAPDVNLKDCTRYRVTGLGINGGFMSLYYQQIGTTLGSTSGVCGIFNIFKMMVNDHDHDILVEYAKHVERGYRGGLLSHLGENYDKSLYRAQSILKDENADLKNPETLLTFLIETDSEVLNQWQKDMAQEKGPMALDSFIQAKYPSIHKSLQDEFSYPRQERR